MLVDNRIRKFLPIAGVAVALIVILTVVRAFRSTIPASPTPVPSPVSPLNTMPSPPPIPQPSAGLGVIHGRLIDEAGMPVPNFPLYLAAVWILQTEAGPEEILLMDTAQALATTTDDDGYFIFPDVEPGKHGIHYGQPSDVGAAFAREQDSQDAILYELAADSVLDAGEIIRRLPPGANP